MAVRRPVQSFDSKGAAERNLTYCAPPSLFFDTIDGMTYELSLTELPKYAVNGKVVVVTASRVKNFAF